MKKNESQLLDEKSIIKDMLKCINSSIDIEEFNKHLLSYTKEYVPEDILIEREERVCRQEELIEKYNSSLICIRVNYPGIIKNNYTSIGIMKILSDVVIKQFESQILYKTFNISAEGPILIIVVDGTGSDIKKRTVNIEENHPLGRFVDIDVYDKCNQSLSRKDFGMDSRKCYICENYAQVCVRNRSHNESDIKKYIEDKYESAAKLNII